VFSTLEEDVCWGGGTNPGVAEVDGTHLVVKAAQAAHEGVSETREMLSVSYFLGEKFTHVVVSNDVLHFDCVVLDPLTHCIFLNSMW
jgi:hypothetical protein